MTSPRRVLALLVVLLTALSGCTVQEQPEEETTPEPVEPALPELDPDEGGGTLRIGLSSSPASLDPRFVVDEEGELIVGAVFEPLVTLDERSEIVAGAAIRWEIDEEGREFTFHLRPASFHDGTPVTAEAFVRTFQRIADGTADPPSFLAYLLAPVEGIEEAQVDGTELIGVEAVDDRTLVIRTAEPEPGFLRALTNPSLVPTPPIADEDPAAFAAQPIGNGPFAVAAPREPEDLFVRLARVEGHHRGPQLDEVLFQIYAEDPGRERQWEDLADGQLHVAEVPPERFAEAEELYGRSRDGYRGPGLITGITSTVYLYGFETTREPFDDPVVRRAISLSIDRDAIADDVMQGIRAPADAIVPPPIPGSQRRPCDHCHHDPEAARALLEEAEIELEALTLTHNRGRTHAAIAEAMASDLEDALGIEVSLQSMDLRPFVQAVRRGDVAVFRLGWEAGEPDPGAYLYPLFHSSEVGLDNLSRFEDEEVDALLDEARREADQRIALSLYREAERLILDQAPVIPLLWYRHSRVVAPDVNDLVLSPFGRIDLARVSLEPAS